MNATALITGASRGIGKAIKSLFIERGIKVIAPTREEMDLNSNDSIDNYINNLKTSINILINNAGINPIDTLFDLKDENIKNTFQINLLAPIRLIKALAPAMMDGRYGRIVNISSIWSFVSKEGRSIYSSTKSGLDAFTRTCAIELAPYNILVNSVAPGFINTELTKQNNTPEQIHTIVKNIPIGRLAEPFEIAEIVFFLSSKSNSFITGQTILADGGYSCS